MRAHYWILLMVLLLLYPSSLHVQSPPAENANKKDSPLQKAIQELNQAIQTIQENQNSNRAPDLETSPEVVSQERLLIQTKLQRKGFGSPASKTGSSQEDSVGKIIPIQTEVFPVQVFTPSLPSLKETGNQEPARSSTPLPPHSAPISPLLNSPLSPAIPFPNTDGFPSKLETKRKNIQVHVSYQTAKDWLPMARKLKTQMLQAMKELRDRKMCYYVFPDESNSLNTWGTFTRDVCQGVVTLQENYNTGFLCVSLCSLVVEAITTVGELEGRRPFDPVSIPDMDALKTQFQNLVQQIQRQSPPTPEQLCLTASQSAHALGPFEHLSEKAREEVFSAAMARLSKSSRDTAESKCWHILGGQSLPQHLTFHTQTEIFSTERGKACNKEDIHRALLALSSDFPPALQTKLASMQKGLEAAENALGRQYLSDILTFQGCATLIQEKQSFPLPSGICASPRGTTLPDCLDLSVGQDGRVLQKGIFEEDLAGELKGKIKILQDKLVSLKQEIQNASPQKKENFGPTLEQIIQEYMALQSQTQDTLFHTPLQAYEATLALLQKEPSCPSDPKACRGCLRSIAKVLQSYLHANFPPETTAFEDSLPQEFRTNFLEKELAVFDPTPTWAQNISNLLLLDEASHQYAEGCKVGTISGFAERCDKIPDNYGDFALCLQALQGVGSLLIVYQYAVNKTVCDVNDPQVISLKELLKTISTTSGKYQNYLEELLKSLGKPSDEVERLISSSTLNTLIRQAGIPNCSSTQRCSDDRVVSFLKKFGTTFPPDPRLETEMYIFATLLVPVQVTILSQLTCTEAPTSHDYCCIDSVITDTIKQCLYSNSPCSAPRSYSCSSGTRTISKTIFQFQPKAVYSSQVLLNSDWFSNLKKTYQNLISTPLPIQQEAFCIDYCLKQGFPIFDNSTVYDYYKNHCTQSPTPLCSSDTSLLQLKDAATKCLTPCFQEFSHLRPSLLDLLFSREDPPSGDTCAQVVKDTHYVENTSFGGLQGINSDAQSALQKRLEDFLSGAADYNPEYFFTDPSRNCHSYTKAP